MCEVLLSVLCIAMMPLVIVTLPTFLSLLCTIPVVTGVYALDLMSVIACSRQVRLVSARTKASTRGKTLFVQATSVSMR